MMIDIDTIVQGRMLIASYRIAHSNDTVELEHRLKGLGFASLQDFFDQSELANWQEVSRCYTWEGECDLCLGRPRGCGKDCAQSFAWDITSNGHIEMQKTLPKPKFKSFIENASVDDLPVIREKSPWRVFYNWRDYPNHLPTNCAYRLVKLDEPKLDIYWNMPDSPLPKDKEYLGGEQWRRRY